MRSHLMISLLTLILLVPASGQAVDFNQDEPFIRHEIRLNDFSGSSQDHVALDRDRDGDILTTWDSRRQESGSYAARAHKLDPLGYRQGGELPLNLNPHSHQTNPATALRNHHSWSVWESWGQDGSGQSVIGRLDDGPEIPLSTTTAGNQEQVVGAFLDDDHLLAIWVSPGLAPGTTSITGRIFDGSGEPLSGEFTLSSSGNFSHVHPTVTVAGDGIFAVAWTRHPLSGGTLPDVMWRRFAPTGAPLGGEMVLATGAFEPSLDCTPAGDLVVAWLEPDRQLTRIMAQRFDGRGERTGSPFSVPLQNDSWLSGVAVSCNELGEFAIAWNRVSVDGEEADIQARFFSTSGMALSDDLLVNKHLDGWQGLTTATGCKRIDLGEDGSLAVAWSGDSGQGDPSAANLTLLIPRPAGWMGKIGLRSRLALAGLRHRIKTTLSRKPHTDPGDLQDDTAVATPYQPPVYDPDFVDTAVDPEPYFGGNGTRDEGWQAISATGWSPPDPHMAAGIDHLMAMTNGGIAAFDKNGTMLWQDEIENSYGFWGELGADNFVFDPEIIFDPHTNRFMAMACERSDNGRSMFLLGISATADPTGDWHKYRFDVTTLAGNDIDSPNMAVDDQAIYLTADFFGPDKYLIYIIDKSSVIDGGAAVTTSYTHTGSQSFGIPVQYDYAPTMYMAEAMETFSANIIKIWAINDPLGSPNLTSVTLTVPTYYDPANARSMGTSATVTTFEARFWSCVYRNGSLWACHHISTDSGRSTVSARWYEIEMNGWPDSGTPTVRQHGTVLPNGTGYATFNSIAVDQFGNAAMCFAYSSTSHPYTMTRVARRTTDPLGEMGEPVFLKAGTTYTQSRWGDYSATVADPVDNSRFWCIHEYAISSSNWSTWIANFVVQDMTSLPDIESGWPAEITGIWPNPSRGATHLAFNLGENAGSVKLQIFDVNGRLVRELGRGALPAGGHEMFWDGKDKTGRSVATGYYLTTIEVDGKRIPAKGLTLVK